VQVPTRPLACPGPCRDWCAGAMTDVWSGAVEGLSPGAALPSIAVPSATAHQSTSMKCKIMELHAVQARTACGVTTDVDVGHERGNEPITTLAWTLDLR